MPGMREAHVSSKHLLVRVGGSERTRKRLGARCVGSGRGFAPESFAPFKRPGSYWTVRGLSRRGERRAPVNSRGASDDTRGGEPLEGVRPPAAALLRRLAQARIGSRRGGRPQR